MVKVKSIAFNEEDPMQGKLLEHASAFKNFSYYVKCLIQRDLEGGDKASNNIKREPIDLSELEETNETNYTSNDEMQINNSIVKGFI